MGYSNGRYRVLIKEAVNGVSEWVELGPVVEAMRFELDGVQRRGGPRDEVGRHPAARSENRVRADCVGSRQSEPALIALYVNGQLVARAEDDEGFPRFDGIGVDTWSEDGRSEAVYDNVVVRELR